MGMFHFWRKGKFSFSKEVLSPGRLEIGTKTGIIGIPGKPGIPGIPEIPRRPGIPRIPEMR